MHEKGGIRICSENSHTAYLTVISNGLDLGFSHFIYFTVFYDFFLCRMQLFFHLYGFLISGFCFTRYLSFTFMKSFCFFLTSFVILFL